MITILFSLAVMGLFVIALSLGLLIKGKELKGTCASQSGALAEKGIVCGVCGKEVGTCETDLSKI